MIYNWSILVCLLSACTSHLTGWSIWTNTGRLHHWHGEPVSYTLCSKYVYPNFIESTAETFSSCLCYPDGMQFYLSHSLTGEAFQLYITIPQIIFTIGSVSSQACSQLDHEIRSTPDIWELRKKWSKLHTIYFSI